MSRSLQPGSSIGHYRVISALGAGGMGEVYLAQDLSLDRSVALKVLPPELVRNQERVRRFVQEAKSASGLSHPHIVTIYEIGQGTVTPQDAPSTGDTAAAGEPIHYIAMELVSGETLGHKIHQEKADLKTLLGFLAQAAEGLAKAHAAGIVHRDLKPENIMITKDGYAKVLDFGLAKLTERQDTGGEATIAATQAGAKTVEGVLMGTVGYMSPEQVLGKGVDHRSDIFSFGCILYEVTARRRSFVADSDIETMHKILRETPTSIEDLNPDVPAELRRLIRRCLAKSPDQRLQSMKDLAIELGEIVAEFDTLSTASSLQKSASSGATLAVAARRRPALVAGIAAVVVLGIAGIGFGIFGVMRHRGAPRQESSAFQSMRMARLTSTGTVRKAVLASDGRYLAQVIRDAGKWSLRVKQVATGSEVEILRPQDPEIRGLNFSPDGEYVFYLSQDTESPLYAALYQLPSLGGTARKLLFDVDTPVSFSPDGQSLAFLRGYPDIQESALMVANADGSGERKLAVLRNPELFPYLGNVAPAWSPDGTRVATFLGSQGIWETATVSVQEGELVRLRGKRWANVSGIAWLPEGSGLVVAAMDPAEQLSMQVWEQAFPSGSARRITNDLNGYESVSVTADSRKLATVQSNLIANLWVAPASDPTSARQVTFTSTSDEAIVDYAIAPNGDVIFVGLQDGAPHLFSMSAEGSNRRQLTSGPQFDFSPEVAFRRDVIVYGSMGQDRSVHLWSLDLETATRSQIAGTAGTGQGRLDPEGRWVVYATGDSMGTLWRRPVAGGEPVRLQENVSGSVGPSPDGTRVAYLTLRSVESRIRLLLEVIPAEGGAAVATLQIPDRSRIQRWAPSGDAIDYVQETAGAWNIWRHPLTGGAAIQLTHYKDLQIFSYDWSPDGTQLFVSRGEIRNDVVLISDFR